MSGKTEPRRTTTRREFLTYRLLLDGTGVFMVREAISSVAIEHREGWLDEIVDAQTGELVDGG